MLVANELVSERADLFEANFPETVMIRGDIRSVADEIVAQTTALLKGRALDVLFATPPCQGMSKNGRGKLLRGVRDGLRDQIDPRNQLATFVPPIVERLQPRAVVFENVPEMEGTLVEDATGELVELLEYLESQLPDYFGTWQVIEFADFGVPQRRQRLITVFAHRDLLPDWGSLSRRQRAEHIFPRPTHSRTGDLLTEPWVSVRDAIKDLPPLDAKDAASARDEQIPFHYVPLLDERKYWWVSNTRAGASAFDNQCVNPSCMSQDNPTLGAQRDDGVNRAKQTTPLFCLACGALLPRPCVEGQDGPRIMSGFTSAYKRMRDDLPASALTRNLSYVSSDQKVHPTQNRALSLWEAMILHTVSDYPYRWIDTKGRQVSDGVIRDSIGESIPPKGLEKVISPLIDRLMGHETRRLVA